MNNMRLKKNILGAFFILATLLLGGCDYALFSPDGEIGIRIRNTMFVTVGFMLLVVIPTLILIIWVPLKYRKKNNPKDYSPDWEHSNKIEFFAWGIPVVIIAILASITYYTSHSLDPRKAIKADKAPLTIQVVAMDWKWLFIYPEEGVATVNEIALPVDRPVEFLITSSTTMNSFFIPRLGGQIYAMAGMENRLNLIANNEGVYDGMSSNYSGYGFAGMRFKAHAVSDAGFQQWLAQVKQSPLKLDAKGFEKLSAPTRDNPVEYFGAINPLQYKNIIESFTGVQ